jgi:hypothetical protein
MSADRRKLAADRRRAPRSPAVFAVKNAAAGGRIQLCQAEDIGPAGMTIKRPQGAQVAPRTAVSLCFALPGSREEIAAEAVVVSDTVAGGFHRTGVRFIALCPEHAQLIAGYCRRRSAPRP